MPRTLVDTTVLFAAAYRRDGAHDDGVRILRSIDDGTLPEAVILDYVLAETLNGLITHAGHSKAVDFLDRLEENARFHLDSLDSNAFSTAKYLFRRHEPFSFVDACLVAYAQTEGLEYLFAFDDDFDGAPNVSRLNAPTNPYDPE